MNRDKHDIIGQIQPDDTIEGGDSVNWMGHWLYLTNDPNWTTDKFIKTFEVGFGGWVRHPDPDQTNNGFGAYYKNPWTGVISRDQMTGILAALIKHGKPGPILRLMLHHACRLFLFSYNSIENGVDPKTAKRKLFMDPTLLSTWAMELRALGSSIKILKPLFWPVLCILDVQMLLNTWLVNSNDNGDPISYAMKLITSVEHIPTPVSKWTYKLCNKSKLLSEIKNYWCSWRDNCEFYQHYKNKLSNTSNS